MITLAKTPVTEPQRFDFSTLALKKLKFSEFASHETNCYEATVYVDGKPFANVGNEGMGGPDMCYPITGKTTWADIKALEDYLGDSRPPRILKNEAGEILLTAYFDLEEWCNDEITRQLTLKELRRKLKASILTLEDGKVWAYKFKGVRQVTQNHIELWLVKHSKTIRRDQVLNLMPEDAALATYTAASEA